MKNLPFDYYALRDLPPQQAFLILAGAAQPVRAIAPWVDIPEALLLAGGVDQTLKESGTPGLLVHPGVLARSFISKIEWIPPYLNLDSFVEWLEILPEEQADALSLQAHLFTMARNRRAPEGRMILELDRFFNLSPVPQRYFSPSTIAKLGLGGKP